MKKIIALALTLVMIFALAVPAASADDTFKAGLICLHDENSGYDANFINAFLAACEATGAEPVIKTNIDDTNEAGYNAACEMADDGCAVVFSDSYGHGQFLMQAAEECPDVQFTSCTDDHALVSGIANFHNAFATIFEGRYLAGVAAGMKLAEMIENGDITLEQAKVGYAGAFPYSEVVSGYTSWFLGVRSIVPEVTMDVVYTGSWLDETLEKEAAEKLIAGGCVLISQHADSMGAPNACEAAGVPNVSYNGSTMAACPNTYIISSRIDWEPYFIYAIQAVMSGENYDTDWTGTTATGSVKLTELNENVAAAGTAEKLEEVQAALADGSLKVFDVSTFTVDGAVLESYMADVQPDAAYEGDTEAVSDGYFHESEYRSAPYFNVTIDGINIL